MLQTARLLVFLMLAFAWRLQPGTALAETGEATYAELKSNILERRLVLAKQWKGNTMGARAMEELSEELTASIRELAGHWIGSSWGRGLPQSGTPGEGKINCGTFVGTLLRDVGFQVDVKKLQRLPSQGIIRSFVHGARITKLVGVPMPTFLAAVKDMGPGLFIIGLDQHVGLLLQTDTELRYFHSSIETGKVAHENAADAWTITSSRYRVVGKILSNKNLRDWIRGNRIVVRKAK